MQLPTAAQMREADRQAIEGHRIPSLFLMENAGQGAFQIIEKYYSPLKDQRVLVGDDDELGIPAFIRKKMM